MRHSPASNVGPLNSQFGGMSPEQLVTKVDTYHYHVYHL